VIAPIVLGAVAIRNASYNAPHVIGVERAATYNWHYRSF
jgi:hypothetical protein